jgi:hypothetical protein
MKSLTEYLTFHLPERLAFVNITPQLEELVRRSGITAGLLLCNAMHITASVFVNDDERGLHEDYKKWRGGVFERHLPGLGLSGNGEEQRVDAGVVPLADDVGRGAAVPVGSPRLPPRGQPAVTEGIDDLLGDLAAEFGLARHCVVSRVGDDASVGVSGRQDRLVRGC